ncbi:asparaginase [Planotetraspora thailandica]|uniref:asparaginase n=1 Tax=Planotetraspora thailandica TaxID=487172 RepID=UPI001EF27FE1|nr:asparaginase domain-containing protein [Planotetraspora thailandica]
MMPRTRLLLLATGDTIAYSYGPPKLATGAELLAMIPSGEVAADVVAEDVMVEPSWDLSPSAMLALARRARAAILDEGFDGVVITHGADTMEDTAFLTDLMAGPAARQGTIVLTGALRALDDPASDGLRNLASALAAAADPVLRGAGAVVCLDGEVHAARWVTQVDAARAPAFASAPLLGRLTPRSGARKVEMLAVPPPRPPDPRGEPESHVALIKTYPDIDPVLLTAVVDAGARGVVLEGTGAGNVPVTLFAAISELSDWDIPVVVASRCRTLDTPLDALPPATGLAGTVGAIGARGLAAVKARAALMVALGSGGRGAVREWFGRL